MTGPRHISEILPSVIDRIAQAHGYTTGETTPAVGSRDTRASQCDRAQGSAGKSSSPPAPDDRDSHQNRMGAKAEGLTIELPFPPSTNHYKATRIIGSGKRAFVQYYVTKAGVKFRQAVFDACLVGNIRTKLAGPLACTVDLYPPCNRRRDADNYNKVLLDSMGAAGLYDDDSQIVDLHIRMHPKHAPGRVVVTLTPISAPQSAHTQLELVP